DRRAPRGPGILPRRRALPRAAAVVRRPVGCERAGRGTAPPAPMSKARPNPWPVLVALLLAMGGVRAESAPRIETFELSQRPGEELMEIVRPLLAPDEAVQADGFRLIVRARPATLEEIEA